ncbi:MAG: FAD-dependent oxidoreductase [Acidobacteria bacterium]|nr:FAD-dependent oxidoreductase [Acidobacteriota bacterium]
MKNNTSRREFLKISTVAATGLMLAGPVAGQSRKKKSCVIIGAGFAGLASALKLKNAGWTVTILEARNRIGGRVMSHRMPENPNLICELGAEWVGESHERIKALCRDFGIPLQKHQFDDFLLRDGRVFKPGEWAFSEAARKAFDGAIKGYQTLTEVRKRAIDQLDWWTYLEKIGFSGDDLRLRDLMDSTDFGESIRHVSAFGALAEYAESSPKNEMDYKMTGGNSRLVEEFAKRIGLENIRTGTPVSEVTQRAGIVSVKTATETFRADAVICTVLTHSLLKIRFDPGMPAVQSQAAERLNYARISKNSVLYRERFWKEENFSMVTDMSSHYYFHSTQSQPGTDGILTAYAIGEKADVLASQSDERRMRVITHDLAEFNSSAPSYARAIASYHWQRDEFTDGAYALYRPGQWFGLRPILQRPHGKVLFAGEHLADWQGFMEGAIETGESAAASLIG